MKRILSLTAFCVCLLAMSSCGNKLALDRDYLTVTPQVLEEVGGKVEATIDGVFPAKAFPAKSTVTITPVLKYAGGESLSAPVSFQGEKVNGNNKVISSKNGGAFSMKASYDYAPEMNRSELFARVDVTKGKKTKTMKDLKLADGVICTEGLADARNTKPAISDDRYQRIVKEVTEANIQFQMQQANVRGSELKTNDVRALAYAIALTAFASDRELSNISVSSYASPDGSMELNENLAAQREKNTISYLNKEMKQSNIKQAIDADFTAEDWEGFKELLEASDIQDKDIILRVLSMYSDPETREQEIKNLATAYKSLADDILPKLRRSKMAVTVDVIGRSDEQIQSEINKPVDLSIDEILYAATLTDKDAEKEEIYMAAIGYYPDEYRAYNNMGSLKFAQGDYYQAKAWFDKAYKIAQAPEVCSNLALCAMATGENLETVSSYLNKAAGASNFDEIMGLYNVKTGEYADAVKNYADEISNNAALAQILAKDYNKAKRTLEAITNPDAQTYYLSAINAARSNNKAEVISALKSAISLDASYAKKAATDIEFAKYVTDAAFAALLK